MSETVDLKKLAKYSRAPKKMSAVKAAAVVLGGGQRYGETATRASKRGWKRIGAGVVASALLPMTAHVVGDAMDRESKARDAVVEQHVQNAAQTDRDLIVQNGVAAHQIEAQISQSIEQYDQEHNTGK